MKIALLGNGNNNLSALARYLNDANYDVTLIEFNNDPEHFSSEKDTFKSDQIKKTRLKWGTYTSYFITSSKTIKKDLEDFDFIIGSRLSPSFLKKAGVKLDIFIPTGGEIWSLPFFSADSYKSLLKSVFFSRIQRKSIIENVEKLFFDYTNIDVEKKITSLGFNGKNRIYSSPPFIYMPEYTEENLRKKLVNSNLFDFFQNIRGNHDLVIFHHASHWWKNIAPSLHHDKGNDRLFKGFASFSKKNPSIKCCIISIPYGPNAKDSISLCKKLKIEHQVFWVEHMPRKEIMLGILNSDIVAGEFKNSWFSYGTIFEGMCMKKPVMHHRNDELYLKKTEGLYPMIHAHSEKDVCLALEKHISNIKRSKDIGEMGYLWFQENAINRPLEEIKSLINKKDLS